MHKHGATQKTLRPVMLALYARNCSIYSIQHLIFDSDEYRLHYKPIGAWNTLMYKYIKAENHEN